MLFKSENARRENWISLIVGIWVMLSPWFFPLHGPDSILYARLISDSLTGAVVVGAAAMALQDLQPKSEWIGFVMGIWLIAAPWALGYSNESAPLWNSTIAGAVIWTAAVFALPIARETWNREHPEDRDRAA